MSTVSDPKLAYISKAGCCLVSHRLPMLRVFGLTKSLVYFTHTNCFYNGPFPKCTCQGHDWKYALFGDLDLGPFTFTRCHIIRFNVTLLENQWQSS